MTGMRPSCRDIWQPYMTPPQATLASFGTARPRRGRALSRRAGAHAPFWIAISTSTSFRLSRLVFLVPPQSPAWLFSLFSSRLSLFSRLAERNLIGHEAQSHTRTLPIYARTHFSLSFRRPLDCISPSSTSRLLIFQMNNVKRWHCLQNG